jgi:hypothetical protein
MSSRNARIVVDGLGRLSGVLELLEHSYDAGLSPNERESLSSLLNGFSIPIVIYSPHPDSEPLSRAEMGQLFFDFNFKAIAVPPRIAISLDMSDPYIQATNRLAIESAAIHENGGMEERAASLGKKSSAIVVQQVLLRFVRGAAEGSAFQESNKATTDHPNLTPDNTMDHVESMAAFIDAFAESMGQEAFTDRKSLHLSSPGWQTLGVIYNDVVHRIGAPDYLKTATKLGLLDWSRNSALWRDLVVQKENADGTEELVLNSAGASTKRAMVAKIRDQLGLEGLIEEAEMDEAIEAVQSLTRSL